MKSLYNASAPKKAANLSINRDLLRRAREFDVNLSAVLESALEETLREHLRARWLAENRETIAAYNAYVAERGVFSDGVRRF